MFHKYVYKIGNRYFYPDDLKKTSKASVVQDGKKSLLSNLSGSKKTETTTSTTDREVKKYDIDKDTLQQAINDLKSMSSNNIYQSFIYEIEKNSDELLPVVNEIYDNRYKYINAFNNFEKDGNIVNLFLEVNKLTQSPTVNKAAQNISKKYANEIKNAAKEKAKKTISDTGNKISGTVNKATSTISSAVKKSNAYKVVSKAVDKNITGKTAKNEARILDAKSKIYKKQATGNISEFKADREKSKIMGEAIGNPENSVKFDRKYESYKSFFDNRANENAKKATELLRKSTKASKDAKAAQESYNKSLAGRIEAGKKKVNEILAKKKK